MDPLISRNTTAIAAICKRYGIVRLEVFGSAARGADFDAELSDADFLVEFAADSPITLQRFYAAKSAFESLLGRPVDLVEVEAVRNPFVRASIEQSREPVYAA